MRNAEKDLKYLMRFARGDIEAIARHWINRALELDVEGDPYWINRALELETENLRLQKEADRLLERERHAVHHSETYKRLVERTREVDKVRKEVEQLREALKHAKEVSDMQKRICPDCGTIMFSAAAQEKYWKCIECGADVEYTENSERAADSE